MMEHGYRRMGAFFQSMSPDEQGATFLYGFLALDPNRQFLWGRPMLEALNDRSFIVSNASVIRVSVWKNCSG